MPPGDRHPPVAARDSDPQLVRDTIDAALDRSPLGRIHVASDSAPPPGVVVNDHSPRLTFGLGGHRRVQIASGLVRIASGDVLIVPRGGWSRPRPSGAHRFAAIDCYDDFTRFVHHHRRRVHGSLVERGAGAWHSTRPLNRAARLLLEAMETMVAEPDGARRARALVRPFAAEALRDCRPADAPPAGLTEWRRAQAWIHEHGGDELARGRIAAAVGVHPNHLSRLCRRHAGISLADYLTEIRMARARHLLHRTDLSTSDVAAAAGYRDLTHFRKRFRAVHGETPVTYRRGRSGRPSGRVDRNYQNDN